ncbi:hypothetical protein [Nocardia sp. NRRL S-836]|uniref:hypothetical protein n=1 Tax=Nocardia sp. NRRL S-836 TaxID=1519492 RepID=UPI0006AF8099|nr:hypothetical protein [Nocardia sp. NRRL S-836]KOV90039.1 hypothetical protein ADL03_01335 [Nocardia sp. NRRL S-836]
MTRWSFDGARFVEEVLKPVLDGWRPDEDLFRVYLLPPDVTDDAEVRAALEEIGRQFGKQQYRNFRRATELLRGQHEAACATLLDPVSRQEHRARVAARAIKLTDAVRQRCQGAPGLPPGEVTALARSLKVARGAVVGALSSVGGRELAPADLGDTPEPAGWVEARGHLAQLRRGSLWDYLTDLGGTATTAARLSARRDKLRVSRSSDTTSETTLLRLVQQWLEGGNLTAVLRFELLSTLADHAAYSYAEAAKAAHAAAHRLAPLGVDVKPDAVAYAVWCARRFTAAESQPAWQEHYQHAVRELRLRAALTVLEQQPNLPEGWQEHRTALAARLSELDAELARCEALEGSDPEAAVAGYLRVREHLADSRIDAAVRRCRPAPPRSATARVQNGGVAVSWSRSTSTAGHIGYRVTRGTTVVCDETTACEYVDDQAPNGTRLKYSVHTLRDGNPSAAPARTTAVVVLGEVTGLELRGEPDRITGRWKLPRGASGVTVTRDGSAVRDAGAESFSDNAVRPGQVHEYLVRTRYRQSDGTQETSDGVRAAASCQEVPVAVTDLVAEFEDDEVVARWTPPPRGNVELFELRDGEEPPALDIVPAARARDCGIPLRPSGISTSGQLRARPVSPGRRRTIVPVTVLGDLAAIGKPCDLDPRQSSVRSLRADRFGSTVRLTWEWPAGATGARIVWRADGKPHGPTDTAAAHVDITRVAYDSRGLSVSIPPGDYWFGVCTTVTSDGVRSFGPLVLRRESATGTARYTVEPGSRFPRRKPRLVVESEHDVPPLVLLAKSGVRPMDSHDGEVLLRVTGGPAPLAVEFDVPGHLRKPVVLRAFSEDDRVVLVPSRPDRLSL